MAANSALSVRCVQLEHAAGLPLPSHATEGAAGVDLVAAIPAPLILGPGQRAAVPTGLVIEVPEGFEAQVRPRSGLALRHGITVLNAPGTIDADYRGEVRVLLINLGQDPVTITRGDRIAQLVVSRVERLTLVAVTEVGATQRGAGGFGSTGS